MTFDVWLTFIVAVLILMSTPGPSQLLILSNALSNGYKRSLMTVAGDLTANLLQMVAAACGVALLITSYPNTLNIIKWAGVSYLVFIGLKQIFSSHKDKLIDKRRKNKTLKRLYMDGFITSLTNPKAVVFFASLFPQFIQDNSPLLPQFTILSLTYISIDFIILTCYGTCSSWIGKRLKSLSPHIVDKFSGFCMILAAVILGSKHL